MTSILNPLRDAKDRRLPRVAGPCSLILFGVTGDLARKKLIPAVYDLANRGLLPPGFALVGFARQDFGHQEFKALITLGYRDCFRLFPQEPGSYSWWDYRAAGFRRNLGLRIDLVLAGALLHGPPHVGKAGVARHARAAGQKCGNRDRGADC